MTETIIRVAKDRSGDYRTVQEAVQATPYDVPTTVLIGPGVYEEKVFCEKARVHLKGAGAEQTILRWADGAYQPGGDGRKTGTFRSYTLFLGGENARVSDLTVHNAAGPGETAGQAVAVYADAARVWMERAVLRSRQDTLFCAPLPEREREPDGFFGPRRLSPRRMTRQYYLNCEIEGDIDFIFGGADAVFDSCDIRPLDRAEPGYILAPCGSREGLGFVLRDCRVRSSARASCAYLGRPWRAEGKAALLRCELGRQIVPAGWDDWSDPRNRETATFCEWESVGPGACSGARAGWARSLTEEACAALEKRADELCAEVCAPWREEVK